MMKKKIEEWPHHDYATRLSVAVVYAFLAAIAVNFLPARTYLFQRSHRLCPDFNDVVGSGCRFYRSRIDHLIFDQCTVIFLGMVQDWS